MDKPSNHKEHPRLTFNNFTHWDNNDLARLALTGTKALGKYEERITIVVKLVKLRQRKYYKWE